MNRIKSLVKQYGKTAIITYSALSFTTFSGCLYAVHTMGIQKSQAIEWLNTARKFIGLSPTNEPIHTNKETLGSEWPAKIVIALIITKLFSPLKVGLTAVLVPRLSRLQYKIKK
jgi:hypothetical protein